MANEYSDEVVEQLLLFGERLDKTVSVLKSEFLSLRAGRANPHVLDKVTVDYYGAKTPVSQMANITVADARCLVIAVWDASALKAVEKAIQEANTGINPVNDGKVIRMVFPELTEERRRDMVKQIKKLTEDSKVALRNIRRDVLDTFKKMKNDKTLTEDSFATVEKEVEKEFNKRIDVLDAMLKDKEKELMTV